MNLFNDIKVLTFAKGPFINSQKLLINHLNNIGINNQIILNNDDLPENFIRQFESHFIKVRGYGYWIWKPYIILNELHKLNDNDILIYVDSTDMPEKIFFEFVIEHFSKNDILLVNRGYNHGEWTKRDCFVYMDCDNEKYYNSVQLEAGIIGLKKTDFNLSLINEWFTNMSNLSILTDDNNICGLNNLPNFKEHRHDQSILTNLSIKYDIKSIWVNNQMIKYNYNQPISYI